MHSSKKVRKSFRFSFKKSKKVRLEPTDILTEDIEDNISHVSIDTVEEPEECCSRDLDCAAPTIPAVKAHSGIKRLKNDFLSPVADLALRAKAKLESLKDFNDYYKQRTVINTDPTPREPSKRLKKSMDRAAHFISAVKDERRAEQAKTVDSTIDRISDFFRSLKPNTLTMILINIVEGNWKRRLLAVLGLFEQMDILFNPHFIEEYLEFIVDFFVFIAFSFTKLQHKFARAQASAAERISAFLELDISVIPKEAVDIVAAAIGLITLLSGGLLQFRSSKHHDMDTFFKDMANSGKTIQGANTAIKSFREIVNWLLKTCGFRSTKDKALHELFDSMRAEALLLDNAVVELGQFPHKMLDGTIDALALIINSKALEEWFLTLSKTTDVRQYQDVYRSLHTNRMLLERQMKSIDNSVGFKQVPVTLYMWGPAGSGKSTIIKELTKQLAIIENRDRLSTYARTISDEFWSSYVQQDIVVYDDFNINAEKTDDTDELMRIVTTAPYLLNLAALQEKSRPFRSRFVFMASNYDCTTNRAYDFSAVDRRRHFLLAVENLTMTSWLTGTHGKVLLDGDRPTEANFKKYFTMTEFVAGIRVQRFRYKPDARGRKDHNSEVERYGPIYNGKDGIDLIAGEVKDLELQHRKSFLRDLMETHLLDVSAIPILEQRQFLEEVNNEQVDQAPIQPDADNPAMVTSVAEFQERVDRVRLSREKDYQERRKLEAKLNIQQPAPQRRYRQRNVPDGIHQSSFFTKPIIWIFVGDSTTGKTELTKELVGEDYLQEHDMLDDDDYQGLCTYIKNLSDDKTPAVLTMNTDKWDAFNEWLVDQEVNGENHTLDRTMRRICLFTFTRATHGFRKRKYTVEDMMELTDAEFESRVIVKRLGIRVAFDFVRESWRDTINSFRAQRISQKNIETCAKKADIFIDLSKLSIHRHPTFDEAIKCVGFHQALQLQNEFKLVNFLRKNISEMALNDASLTSVVRTLNNLHLKYPMDKSYQLRFLEGDVFFYPDDGCILAAVGNLSRIRQIRDHFYFVSPDGEKRVMEQEEIDAHHILTGRKLVPLSNNFVEIEMPEEDEEIQTSMRAKILHCSSLVLNSFAALLSGFAITINLMDLFEPHSGRSEHALHEPAKAYLFEGVSETRKGRARERIARRDDQDMEELWQRQQSDMDDQQFERIFGEPYGMPMSQTPRVVKSRYICRCDKDRDYDCALCSGSLPRWAFAESSYSREERPEYRILESHTKQVDPKTSKIRVESVEQKVGVKRAKITVESSNDHYRQLLESVDSKPSDGSEVYADCLKREKHHIDSKGNFCWKFVTGKRAPGGVQAAHHYCKTCKNYVVRLNGVDPNTRKCYGCSGFKMPESYYHQPCKHCANVSEGCVDGSYRAVAAKINGNIISFHGFTGLMLEGKLGVAPNHCFDLHSKLSVNGDTAEVKKRIIKKDLCLFELVNKTARSYPSITHLMMHRGDLLQPKQRCFLNIPSAYGIDSYPIIAGIQDTFTLEGSGSVDCLRTSMTVGGSFDSYVTASGDCGATVIRMDNSSVKKLVGIHCGGSDTHGYVALVLYEDLFEGVKQSLSNEDVVVKHKQLFLSTNTLQWCPYLSEVPQRFLCSGCSHYCLDKDDGRDGRNCGACRGLITPPFFKHIRSTCPNCKENVATVSEYKCLPTHQVKPAEGVIGNFEVVGQTVNTKGIVIAKQNSGKTKLRESPLRCDRFGEVYEPAILSTEDPRNKDKVDPYIKNVDKWNLKRPEQDREGIKAEFREMGQWYATLFHNRSIPLMKLTVDEAINRHTAYVNSNPIYLHTSAGFPYNNWKNVRHKFPMLDFNEGLQRYRIAKETPEGYLLQLHVEYLLRQARKGQKVAVVFDVNLKDEALPKTKIDLIKTRSIVSCPLDFTIVQRQLVHTVGCALMETRAYHPIKLGIAPNTIEWHDLFLYLTKHTEYGFDADYKAWDANVTEEEISGLAEFYNTLQETMNPDWTEQDSEAVRTLYASLSMPLITRRDLVVRSIGGLISGEGMTGVDNSLLNTRKMWHCWKSYLAIEAPKAVERKPFSYFVDNVRFVCNGDDHIVMPMEQDPKFNFEFVRDHMKEIYNVGYTPADKVSDVSNKHITDMTFLKRHFIVKAEFSGFVSGGLVDAAFSKMTGTTRVPKSALYQPGVQYDQTNFGQTIETYLLESCLRGRKFYNDTIAHVRKVCDKYPIPLPYFSTFEQTFNLVYHSNKMLMNSFI